MSEDLTAPLNTPQSMLAALASAIHRAYAERDSQISGQIQPHRKSLGEDWTVLLDRKPYQAAVTAGRDSVTVEIGRKKFEIETLWQLGDPLFRGSVNGRDVCVQIDRTGVGYRLFHNAGQANVLVLQPQQARLAALMPVKLPPDTSKFLLSPMPGLLVSVGVMPEGVPVVSKDQWEIGNQMGVLQDEYLVNCRAFNVVSSRIVPSSTYFP